MTIQTPTPTPEQIAAVVKFLHFGGAPELADHVEALAAQLAEAQESIKQHERADCVHFENVAELDAAVASAREVIGAVVVGCDPPGCTCTFPSADCCGYAQAKTWWTHDIAQRKRMVVHASDCAIYNAPALPPGPCDCHQSRQQAAKENGK